MMMAGGILWLINTIVSLDDKLWLCRYFADFKNGIVYTWSSGATSWSVPRREHKDAWSFAKLAEV